MKHYFTLILLLLIVQVNAQNYSCIAPEHKTFFTNGLGYLRGMRIDSIKSNNGATIYYPFKTARIDKDMVEQVADTNGGSWLGAQIIEDTTGVTYIPTRNGDTVILKNNAALNESWIFYQDTGARYYEATVVAKDTATFVGISDSVKIIRINAKEGNSIITADSLNDLEIILSKSHGLVQAIGFYLFPYRFRLTGIGIDYYFDQSFYSFTTQASLMFKRVPFIYPKQQAVYDFEVGDILVSQNRLLFDDLPPSEKSISITQREDGNASVSYQFSYTGFHYQVTQNHLDTIYESGTGSWVFSEGMVIDSTKMPEEWFNPSIYFYKFMDTSYCIASNVYRIANGFLGSDGRLYYFEQGQNSRTYKEKLGKISEEYEAIPIGFGYMEYLVRAKKGDLFCNSLNTPLDIQTHDTPDSDGIKIYPNPADEALHIQLSKGSDAFRVVLFDITGRKILEQRSNKQIVLLPVKQLRPGMYFLNIFAEGKVISRKVVISH